MYDNLERAVATEGDEDSPHKKGLEMIFHQYQGDPDEAGRHGDRGPGPDL